MFLLSVIPISKSRGLEELSYFSTKEAEVGDLVSVPLRGKKAPGLVIAVTPVADAKSIIRSARFQLRKISGTPKKGVVDKAVVTAGLRLAEYHAAKASPVCSAILPVPLLESAPGAMKESRATSGHKLAAEKLVLQANTAARLEQYRLIVREEFARGTSLLIAAPTIIECDMLYRSLSRGIEEYTVVLGSHLSPKMLKKNLATAHTTSHPILIIATPAYLSFFRDDITLTILERENAESWRSVVSPYIDFRVFAEFLAEARGTRLLFAGEPLRVATSVRHGAGELEERVPVSRRRSTDTYFRIIDARIDAKKLDALGKYSTAPFTAFSSPVREALATAIEQKKKIVLLGTRRGLSPITVCGDCGSPVLCEFSGTPVALMKSPMGNVFLCRACGDTRSANEGCKNCGSWKLVPLGIGIERIADELAKLFAAVPCVSVDPSHKRSPAAIGKQLDTFFQKEGAAFLLGTEMMLPYLASKLPTRADLAVVVSMDALLSMPEWNAYERAYSILLRLAESASEEVVVQTRMMSNVLLGSIQKEELASFYRAESETRKQLGYPPFSIFIKICVEGSRAAVESEMKKTEEALAPYPLLGSGRPLHLGGNHYRMNAFMRLPKSAWPDTNLIEKLRSLPPSVTVITDPASVL